MVTPVQFRALWCPSLLLLLQCAAGKVNAAICAMPRNITPEQIVPTIDVCDHYGEGRARTDLH